MKKKRKRIAGKNEQVSQKDNYFDFWKENGYDECSEDSLGQIVKKVIQDTNRQLFVWSDKAAQCSHTPRQHYRDDEREKVAYESLYEAKKACAYWWDKNEDMYPYRCTYCNQYHIGHKIGGSHSIPFNIHKSGELLGHSIDLAVCLKELFANDNRVYTCPY